MPRRTSNVSRARWCSDDCRWTGSQGFSSPRPTKSQRLTAPNGPNRNLLSTKGGMMETPIAAPRTGARDDTHTPLVRLRGIEKSFDHGAGRFHVLRRVDLDV